MQKASRVLTATPMISAYENSRRFERNVSTRAVHNVDLFVNRTTEAAAPTAQDERYISVKSQYASDLFMYRN
jgi:hypothetical protein